jgi:hypothetical protein
MVAIWTANRSPSEGVRRLTLVARGVGACGQPYLNCPEQTVWTVKVDPPLTVRFLLVGAAGVSVDDLASAIDQQAQQHDHVLLVFEAIMCGCVHWRAWLNLVPVDSPVSSGGW